MSKTFSVPGFQFSSVACGIKQNGELDVGLIVADTPAVVAGIFTTNPVQAAPVHIAREHCNKGICRAVLVNSGNANACTGAKGHQAAQLAIKAVAEQLGIPPNGVVPASTGVIGQVLPAEKISAAAPSLVQRLSPGAIAEFSRAIMTTDRTRKLSTRYVKVGKEVITIAGVAKGAGMIHPNMATTLAFVLTDAKVTAAVLRKMLRQATEQTFHRISVDGDTSTNDTIVALASGKTGKTITVNDKAGAAFLRALTEVLGELAHAIVSDGEGAEHMVHFSIEGLKTHRDAERVTSHIIRSSLVKTALYGQDPNWGRILVAAGSAGVSFNPEAASIAIEDVYVAKKGQPVGAKAEAKAKMIMQRQAYTITVKLGSGPGRARYTTCDLGHEYIRINAGYRS